MSIFLWERLLFSRLFRHGIERIGKAFCDRARTIFVFVKNGGVRVSVLWLYINWMMKYHMKVKKRVQIMTKNSVFSDWNFLNWV